MPILAQVHDILHLLDVHRVLYQVDSHLIDLQVHHDLLSLIVYFPFHVGLALDDVQLAQLYLLYTTIL